MQDIPSKVNGVSTLADTEFNQLATEAETLITASGQALSGGSTNQMARSAAIHAAVATYYTDSGAVNSYVVAPVGSFLTPSAYTTGMIVRFKPANANSGASTINVNSLGIKSIKAADGSSALASGNLPAGTDVELIYDGTNFRLSHVAFSAPISGTSTLSPIGLADGRLTLTSNVPVTTADVSGAGTLYYTPYVGNRIALYDGSTWTTLAFTQQSISVPASATTVYDVFAYNSAGTVTLELTAWTNDTTRATSLAYQDGVLVKSGTTTRRYLGSFRTVASSQTEDSTARRFLFNYYHRILRFAQGIIPTATWNYTTATIRSQNTNTTVGQGRIELLCGVSEDVCNIRSLATSSNANAGGASLRSGYGVDSTTAFSGSIFWPAAPTGGQQGMWAHNFHQLAVGYHFVQLLEYSQAVSSTTWFGNTQEYSNLSVLLPM